MFLKDYKKSNSHKHPILQVIFDEENNMILLVAPDKSKKIYSTNYGRIGQQLEEIGRLIQRKRWPHFMCDLPWTHIIPDSDIIQHQHSSYSFTCKCNPKIDTVKRMVLHECMDPGVEKFSNSPMALNPGWKIIEP